MEVEGEGEEEKRHWDLSFQNSRVECRQTAYLLVGAFESQVTGVKLRASELWKKNETETHVFKIVEC